METNKQKKTPASDKSRYTVEKIRLWSLEKLMNTVEAPLDLSQCHDPCYLSQLTADQSSKIKRICYGKDGQVTALEPMSIVEVVKAVAEIAGTREDAAAKAKEKAALAVKDAKEQQGKQRSNKITLAIPPAQNSNSSSASPKTSPQPKNSTGNTLSSLASTK